MSLKNTLISIFVVFILALLLSDGGKKEYAHWGYDEDLGPSQWANLDERYNMCEEGLNQSPINIADVKDANLSPLIFQGNKKASTFVNDGHTVQVNFKRGNQVKLDNINYKLKQMHFHTPSENQINGKSFPLEAHLVHSDKKGNLLVIAVVFDIANEDNPVLNKLLRSLPKNENDKEDMKSNVSGYEIIPEIIDYYTYSGSLTIPPCSEGVRWVVLKSTVNVSQNQLDEFTKVMPTNNRPIQKTNGRYILD